MKKNLFVLIMLLPLLFNAQTENGKKEKVYTNPVEFYKALEDGSYAPNFSLQDLNGTTHTLYDYLDQGKTVFIDFFAVWCSPCWNFMNYNSFENLYKEHGPAGYQGVNANTTDDVMVFAIEASGNNANLSCLQGDNNNCNHPYGTQGDWITAAGDLPLIPTYSPNSVQVVYDYEIDAVPTLYKICPNRIVEEVSQSSSADFYYSMVSECPPPASNINDVVLFSIDEPTNYPYCVSEVTPKITIQNYGTSDLTSVEVKVYIDNVEEVNYTWTGLLATYEITQITLPTVTLNQGANSFKVELLEPNGAADQDLSNNEKEITVNSSPNGAHVVIDIFTDNYPDETTWELYYDGNVIASGGPYNLDQTHIENEVCLEYGNCYDFVIYDSYGDGMSYNNVTGSVTITFLWGSQIDTLVHFGGDEFTTSRTENFCIEEQNFASFNILEDVDLYPNPAVSSFKVSGGFGMELIILSQDGKEIIKKILKSNNEEIDVSLLQEGYYIVKLLGERTSIVKKLIIVR